MEEKKKRKNVRGYLFTALLVVIGMVFGFSIPYLFDLSFMAALEPVERFLAYVVILMLIWLAYMVQVVLHELGHLLGGVLSGYRFSSFRIGRLMLIKIDGKLAWKRFFLAGTGGQCLMIPTEHSGVFLFHLGGALVNLLVGGACLAIFFLPDMVVWLEMFVLFTAVFGLIFAILNGIPLRTGLIANDGSNAVALKKDPAAAEQLANHLRLNAMSVDGLRLREMPAEWFRYPSAEQLKNNAFAETAVFACNRLIDEHRFADAVEMILSLLAADSAVTGVHRKLLICDLIYCEAIGERRNEVFVKWMDREQLNFIRSMKTYPSVIRTEYAYTRLFQQESIRAAAVKARFEKCIAAYPNRGDILSERELMAYVDKIETEEA